MVRAFHTNLSHALAIRWPAIEISIFSLWKHFQLSCIIGPAHFTCTTIVTSSRSWRSIVHLSHGFWTMRPSLFPTLLPLERTSTTCSSSSRAPLSLLPPYTAYSLSLHPPSPPHAGRSTQLLQGEPAQWGSRWHENSWWRNIPTRRFRTLKSTSNLV